MLRFKPSRRLLKSETTPFLYKWTQLSTGIWYVGSRTAKGCHPEDGYICSSHSVKKMILSNPDDWRREILKIGKTVEEIRMDECVLLNYLDARNRSDSFNKTNSDYGFVGSTTNTICINDGHTEKYIKSNELDFWSERGWSRGRSVNSKLAIGKTMSDVRKTTEWPSMKGTANGRAVRYRFVSPMGQEYLVYGTLDKFCREHSLSKATIQKALSEGWIPRRGKCAGWSVENLDTGKKTQRDTLNYGKARCGKNNPYYGGKSRAK